jgi:hypothetical protein
MEARSGWTPPRAEQLEHGRRAFEKSIKRIRAERQAIRNFTAYVLAKLAEGAPLAAM